MRRRLHRRAAVIPESVVGPAGTALASIPILSVVPDVRGDTVPRARQGLSSAGLGLGSVGSRVDCDNLGIVVGQSPAAGSTASVGSAVAVSVGARPKPPAVCP